MNQKKTGINAPSKLGGGKIAATPRTRRSLLKTPGSQHKKDDDVDMESGPGGANKDYMEKKYKQDNDQKLDLLANSVSSIKQMSRNIGSQMEEEKSIIGSLDTGFVKSKDLVNNIVGSMDTMLKQTDSSLCGFILLFTFLMVAFLVYFG